MDFNKQIVSELEQQLHLSKKILDKLEGYERIFPATGCPPPAADGTFRKMPHEGSAIHTLIESQKRLIAFIQEQISSSELSQHC